MDVKYSLGPLTFTASSYILAKNRLSWMEPIRKAILTHLEFYTARFSFYIVGIFPERICVNLTLVVIFQVS